MSQVYNIAVDKGCSLNLLLNLKDTGNNALNLSGCSLSGQVKRLYGETGVLVNLQPAVVTPASGQVSIFLPATGTLVLPVGKFFYEVFLISGTNATLSVEGDFDVYPTVFGV
jgi:hypothetical protein